MTSCAAGLSAAGQECPNLVLKGQLDVFTVNLGSDGELSHPTMHDIILVWVENGNPNSQEVCLEEG